MKTSAVYTDEELKKTLADFYQASSSNDSDCDHIFGHADFKAHTLSMLQKVTATVLLDYQTYCNDSRAGAPSLSDLERVSVEFAQTHGPILNLQTVIAKAAPRMALAAEFKRASPSKGDIAGTENMHAGRQAVSYYTAGADIISCLTESRWFKGSLADLTQIRLETTAAAAAAAVSLPSRRPRPAVLRKDFVVNEYMIAEAAAAGADTVLLIVAVLSESLLTRLIQYCRSQFAMEPLVEVHADEELTVALRAGARVIGVNNRNLHTFQLDLATSERMAARLNALGLPFRHDDIPTTMTPAASDCRYTLCALSGMSTCYDVDRYRQVGLSMCLIGESLMRAADPAAAIASLCLDPADFAAREQDQQQGGGGGGGAYTMGTQVIKVCGITNADDALVACRAGAHLIGIIFVPRSPRCVTVDQAVAVVQAVREFGERQSTCDWSAWASSSSSSMSHLIWSANTLAQTIRQQPVVVGVFQNQDVEFIRDMVQTCGLDMVQLHGREGMGAANFDNFKVPVIRVMDVTVDPVTGAAAADAVEVILQAVTSDPAVILLDTAIKSASPDGGGGGTGVAFDWSIARRIQDSGLPVMIAGGLTPISVQDCVTRIRPFGVDVSSGVEASPGKKDHDKVQRFISTAKSAAVEVSKGF
jgi:indole-3-glycerol phosphate synthase/phosphoribosylanthranilate isomerase